MYDLAPAKIHQIVQNLLCDGHAAIGIDPRLVQMPDNVLTVVRLPRQPALVFIGDSDWLRCEISIRARTLCAGTRAGASLVLHSQKVLTRMLPQLLSTGMKPSLWYRLNAFRGLMTSMC